jgi:hypothetical protein
MGWKKKYKLVGLQPGVVVTRQFGEIDFSKQELDIAKLDKLYQSGFPFLEKIKPATIDKGKEDKSV